MNRIRTGVLPVPEYLFVGSRLRVCAARAALPDAGAVRRLASAFGDEYVSSLSCKNAARTAESFTGALLVLSLLEEKRVPPGRIIRNEWGKPGFAGDGMPFFSVSHDGGIAAVALSTAFPVGLDITESQRIRGSSAERLAARFFGPGEASAVSVAPPGRRAEVFSALWADMEARAKLEGVRLADRFGLPSGEDSDFLRFGLTFCGKRFRVSVCMPADRGEK